MINLVEDAEDVLSENDYATYRVSSGCLLFEDETVMGFLFVYESVDQLIERWEAESSAIVRQYRLRLQSAQNKAWNAYTVLLTAGEPSYSQYVRLCAIEENLVGTRKIARAGIGGSVDLRHALLSLLPIQSSPKLEAIDVRREIGDRVTHLPKRVVEAFFAGVAMSVLVSVLEEQS